MRISGDPFFIPDQENSSPDTTPEHKSNSLRASGGILSEINWESPNNSGEHQFTHILEDSVEFPYLKVGNLPKVEWGIKDLSPPTSPERSSMPPNLTLITKIQPSANESTQIPNETIKALFKQLTAETRKDEDRQSELYLHSENGCEEFTAGFRFTNISCPIETSVKECSLKPNEFFHGNYISINETQKVIATQYPKEGRSSELFWEIFYNLGAVVIDLTNFNDDRRRRGPDYKPVIKQDIHDIQIQPLYNPPKDQFLELTNQNELFSLRRFKFIENGEDRGEKDIIRYTGWEDHNGSCPNDLICLVNLVRSYVAGGKIPILHCMAGVGRTGSLITLLTAAEKILKGEIDRGNLLINLKEIILKGRLQRGENFVQTDLQLETIVRSCELILEDPAILKL